jgi:aminopeptidase N
MFKSIAAFEFRYQLKNPLFWVTYAIFFLMSYGATTVSQIRIGSGGNVHKNAPFAIILTNGVLTVFAIFTLVAFVANVVLRDDDTGYGPIIRSTRIRKFDYLIGRFTGAFGVAALSFTSVSLGIFVGSFMPWVDSETLGPNMASAYLYAYFLVALPTLFLCGSIFFAVAIASRSMMATYLAVVGFLVAYFSASIALDKPEYETIGALIDPFGLSAFGIAVKYWTAADRNTLLPAIDGLILYNRLIWIGIAGLILCLAYFMFQLGQADKGTKKKAPPIANFDRPLQASGLLPRPHFSGATTLAQLVASTRIDMNFVFRSPGFFVLLAIGLLNTIPSLWIGTELYGNPTYPVTRASIETLRQAFSIIPIIVAIYYAGELVWRDRDRKIHEIIDATPVPDWIFVLPKVLAIFLVLVATLLISVVAAIGVQIVKGYYVFELDHYLIWYLLPTAVQMLNMAILAMFAQALSPSKYVGWGVMGLYMVSTITLVNLGFEHQLYRYNSAPGVPLSDMNGQGQFWIARTWLQVYWSAFAAILTIFAYALWRRGTETRFAPRFARLGGRLKGTAGALLAIALLIFVGTGSYIYYNTNILNTYQTSLDRDDIEADMEKALLAFSTVPQPRIIDVVLDINLEPHANRATIIGKYVVENRTDKPIDKIHIRWMSDLDMVKLDMGPAKLETDYEKFNYRIYALETALAPGEKRYISFETLIEQRGFRHRGNGTRLVDNGTFLNNFEFAPVIGMDKRGLLQDRIKRRKHGLPAELRPAKLEDDSARANHVLGKDSDWVNADITITTVADQTPIAPGYKQSDEVIGDRRRARFKTEAPILNFFSIQSGRYAEAHDKAGDIDLTVYYHPAHQFNVQRILTAMKTTLDVLPKAFSPYQFRQARIIEFPAYATFAQSFANTIPFSESIGFIVNQDKDPEGIDFTSFVTAHELGHQWWAHQVVSADMQGSTMLVETFAQYSAMLVMERLYGPDQVRKFLKFELDYYLRARGGEVIEELPLARVENQAYIHYRKGAVAMYLLKDQVGEDAVNRAMRRLIDTYAFKSAPYPASKDFLKFLREEAPGHDALITDLFERIVLYDIKVTKATSSLRKDGQYDVTIEVDAKKFTADGLGKETDAPLDELFDVGLFAVEPGKKGFNKDKVIAFTKMPIKTGAQTLTLVSATEPAFAGVDPYNKRITRNSDSVISKVSLVGSPAPATTTAK